MYKNMMQKSTLNRNADIENQHCLHRNRLPARTTVIPAKTTGIYYRNKEQSDLLQSLNGDWHFSYQNSDCLEGFYHEDYDVSPWDSIDVPSMWQYRGYGKPVYPNIEYPIPFHPPYVCCENPVGYYRRTFQVEKKRERTILHFGGVDNAFYVYVNGTFVGFSKGSRIPAEFDVSEHIREGENTIAVKVFTYSDATYLENQDMLMASGIFRDVYLIHTDEVSLWDYRVTTTMNSFMVRARLHMNREGDGSGYKVRMSLDGQSITFDAASELEHTFVIENPRLWNAEQPNLYDLHITITRDGEIREIHSKRVGIMHTKCEGRTFYVNGTPAYIKGINRHECDCKNGRAISVEMIEQEIRMIKDNNLNAIRCAHYNNNPAFYEIASELGLYVMAEADIETHGCSVTGDQGWLNKQSDWYDAFFDRISRMLETNKNEPCIFIWSAGNECGEGENLNRCMQYIKQFDPTKAMTYTQVKAEDRLCPPYSEFSSVGYPAMEKLREFEQAEKPVLLIEYAHAMGNSPGFLQGYQDYIYANDHVCGGFVWEFKSHGFQTEDGNILYGGDFSHGDKYHWYNFCLDGFLTSDGTPKPVWYELGEVMAPIYVTFEGQEKLKLYNTNDFTAADYLTLRWEILEDYEVLKGGTMELPKIRPHQSAELDLDLEIENPAAGAKYYINLLFYDKERQVSKKQFELPVSMTKEQFKPKKIKEEEISIAQNATAIWVETKAFRICIKDGLLCKYVSGDKVLLDAPMQFNCYRATTDNDGVMCSEKWFPTWFGRHKEAWGKAFLNTMSFQWESMEYEKQSDCVIIKTAGKVIPDYEYLGFCTEITYRIFEGGEILVDIRCEPFGNLPDTLPRLGVVLETAKCFDRCRWYGRGPEQNYCDARANAHIGLYEAETDSMNFMFDMPQDTGNREDTSFVQVYSESGEGLSVIGCDSFSFEYHDFEQTALDTALHRNELHKSDRNYLYVNYRTRGLGSRACGPDPEQEYELYPHAFAFAFVIAANADSREALRLARSDFGVKTKPLGERYVYVPIEKQEEIADCDEG